MMPSRGSRPDGSAFAISAKEFRRIGHEVVDLVAEYLSTVRDRPVYKPMTVDERRVLLDQPLPEEGVEPEIAIRRFVETVLPHPMGNGHPRFFGWVNSPPAPIGVLAEVLAAAMDPSCAGGDHAAIYLERCAVRWLMELLGFPVDGSMGLLVSGGSMASLICLAAARHRAVAAAGGDVRAAGLPRSGPPFIVYTSEEGHSCLHKSAELLGLGASAVHTVAVDTEYRLDVASLRAAITDDRGRGALPFCVSASAGTVNTGAIDPLASLADLCAEEGLWLHVDGAYGALGALDPAAAHHFAGMERADSVALDPHKWLSVPVECGCALVRDARLLRNTYSLVPAYLQTEEGKGFGGLPWYSEYGFQQTRGFRALKLWMTLQHLGRRGIAAQIAGHNALARRLATLIDAAPDLELITAAALSIVCFRYAPPAWSREDPRLDALNKTIMQEVQAGGEAFVTNAVLRGRFVLRACILHYETTEDDLAALIDVVRRTGNRLARGDGT